MLTLYDGRSELWQWDTGRTLSVPADCSQVHFSNKVFGRSVDVDVVDGAANIPDILLQTDKELTAWAFVGTAENGYTKISKVFKVKKRNKPADYVFTPTDQTTLDDILDRIEDLEKRPSGDVSEEDIQNAVNDYLEKNPVSINEKDPTVPDWAKQPQNPHTQRQRLARCLILPRFRPPQRTLARYLQMLSFRKLRRMWERSLLLRRQRSVRPSW